MDHLDSPAEPDNRHDDGDHVPASLQPDPALAGRAQGSTLPDTLVIGDDASVEAAALAESVHPTRGDPEGNAAREMLARLRPEPGAELSPATPPPKAPQARIRFNAPGVLSFDGYEETFAATLLDLSEGGLSCSGPQGLAKGDRVRLKFALEAGEPTHSYLCEVRWLRPSSAEAATYGLQFLALPQPLQRALRDTVQRSLPAATRHGEFAALAPAPKSAPSERFDHDRAALPEAKATSSWRTPLVAGSAGVLGGIALTLAMLALFPADVTPEEEAAVAVAPPQAPTLPLEPLVDRSDEGAAAPPSGDIRPPAVAPAPQAAPAPTAALAPKARAVAQVANKSLDAERTTRLLGRLKVEEERAQTRLALPLDGPSRRHDTFWLHNPERLVVDVARRKSALGNKAVEVLGRHVVRLRVGEHPGKTRFVIETRGRMVPEVDASAEGKTLRLTLKDAG